MSTMLEQDDFSPLELAAKWKLSRTFIRKLFLHEPGVILTRSPGCKDRYTMRIPASVAARVRLRSTVK